MTDHRTWWAIIKFVVFYRRLLLYCMPDTHNQVFLRKFPLFLYVLQMHNNYNYPFINHNNLIFIFCFCLLRRLEKGFMAGRRASSKKKRKRKKSKKHNQYIHDICPGIFVYWLNCTFSWSINSYNYNYYFCSISKHRIQLHDMVMVAQYFICIIKYVYRTIICFFSFLTNKIILCKIWVSACFYLWT